MAEEPNGKFDLIALDAFSSDAIPVHLVTTEAIALYKEKLTDDGLILVNITNNYLNLESVVANVAAANDLRAFQWYDAVVLNENEKRAGKFPSRWMVLTQEEGEARRTDSGDMGGDWTEFRCAPVDGRLLESPRRNGLGRMIPALGALTVDVGILGRTEALAKDRDLVPVGVTSLHVRRHEIAGLLRLAPLRLGSKAQVGKSLVDELMAIRELELDALAQTGEQRLPVSGKDRLHNKHVLVDQSQICQRQGERHATHEQALAWLLFEPLTLAPSRLAPARHSNRPRSACSTRRTFSSGRWSRQRDLPLIHPVRPRARGRLPPG